MNDKARYVKCKRMNVSMKSNGKLVDRIVCETRMLN